MGVAFLDGERLAQNILDYSVGLGADLGSGCGVCGRRWRGEGGRECVLVRGHGQ